MGTIRLSVGQINILNYLMINVREVSDPTVIVHQEVIPPPVPATQNLVFVNMNDVVHYIDFRSSNDGVSLGLLLSTFVYDVANQNVVEKRFYTVGGSGPYDPADMSSTITDPYFVGKTVSGVFKEAFRDLEPLVEWSQTGDTITLIGQPVLTTPEKMIVEIQYSAAVSGSSTSKSFPLDILEIPSDTTLDATHQNKMIVPTGAMVVQTFDFPGLNFIPNGTKYGFNTHKVDAVSGPRYTKLTFPSGTEIYVGSVLRDELYIGRGEVLEIQKKGNAFYINHWDGDVNRVGELVWSDKAPVNGLPETGSWESFASYPRIFYWYVDELDPAVLGTGTFPSRPAGVNAMKFCVDAAAEHFWIPDSGGYFTRNTDPNGDVDTDIPAGDRKSGTTEADAIGEIVIDFKKGNGFTGGPAEGDKDKFSYGSASTVTRSQTFNVGKNTHPDNIRRNAYRII